MRQKELLYYDPMGVSNSNSSDIGHKNANFAKSGSIVVHLWAGNCGGRVTACLVVGWSSYFLKIYLEQQ